MYYQVLCATIDDESRFRELIEGWIEEGSVPAFPSFISEKKSKRKARKRKHDAEAKEAEEALREIGGDPSKYNFVSNDGFFIHTCVTCTPGEGEDGLKALIKARQQSREEKLDGFFDSLELKYCTKKPKTTASGSSKAKKATKSSRGDASSSKTTRAKKSKK